MFYGNSINLGENKKINNIIIKRLPHVNKVLYIKQLIQNNWNLQLRKLWSLCIAKYKLFSLENFYIKQLKQINKFLTKSFVS